MADVKANWQDLQSSGLDSWKIQPSQSSHNGSFNRSQSWAPGERSNSTSL